MASHQDGGFLRDATTGALLVSDSGASLNKLTGVYVPSDGALLKAREAGARARLGGSPVRVHARGDSTTLGTLSGTNPNTLLRRDYTWHARARQTLQAMQALPGTVEESIIQIATADDARFTYGTGWSASNGGMSAASTATGTATFAETSGGHDAFDLTIQRQASATTVSVSVDGGTAQVLTVSGLANNAYGVFRVTGTGTGTHSVVISAPAAGTITLFAVEPVLTTGLPIVKMGGYGVSGQTLATVNPTVVTAGNPMHPLLGMLPDIEFLFMGVNDMRGSADLAAGAATYKTNVQAFVSAFQAQSTDVVLVSFPSYNSNQSGQASATESALFQQAIYDVANTSNCAVLDLQRRWGTGVTPTTNAATTPVSASAMYDGTHPTLLGYWDIGRMVASFLAHTL